MIRHSSPERELNAPDASAPCAPGGSLPQTSFALPPPETPQNHGIRRRLARLLPRLGPSRRAPSRDEALAALAHDALESTGAEGAAIAIEQDQAIECVARAGALAPPLGAVVLPETGISGECFRSARLLYCRDAETDPRVDAVAFRQFRVRSVIAAPLIDGARARGLLEVFASQPDAFGERECELLQTLAAAAALTAFPPDPVISAAPVSAGEEAPGGFSAARGWVLGALVALVAGGLLVSWLPQLRPSDRRANQPPSPTTVSVGPEASARPADPGAPATLGKVRHRTHRGFTAIEVALDRPVVVSTGTLKAPPRAYFDLKNTHIAGDRVYRVDDRLVSSVRMGQTAATISRIVVDLKCACTASFVMSQREPYRLLIDVEPQGAPARPRQTGQ